MGTCGTPDRINDSQLEIMNKIKQYGKNNGYDDLMIHFVQRVAWKESTLNPNATNGKYEGLFQYSPNAWNGRGSSRFNVDDQIKNFFEDMDRIKKTWWDKPGSDWLKQNLDMYEFLYTKFSDGEYAKEEKYREPAGGGGDVFKPSGNLNAFQEECFEPDRIPKEDPRIPDDLSPYYPDDEPMNWGSGHNCRPYTITSTVSLNVNGFPFNLTFTKRGNTCTEDGDTA